MANGSFLSNPFQKAPRTLPDQYTGRTILLTVRHRMSSTTARMSFDSNPLMLAIVPSFPWSTTPALGKTALTSPPSTTPQRRRFKQADHLPPQPCVILGRNRSLSETQASGTIMVAIWASCVSFWWNGDVAPAL